MVSKLLINVNLVLTEEFINLVNVCGAFLSLGLSLKRVSNTLSWNVKLDNVSDIFNTMVKDSEINSSVLGSIAASVTHSIHLSINQLIMVTISVI